MSLGYIGIAVLTGFAAAAFVGMTGGGVMATLASYSAAGTITLLLSMLLSGLRKHGTERSAPDVARTVRALSRSA